MIILGIETSCDDTGIALIKISRQRARILSNIVSSQVKIHAPYGGVVPNLAARAHLENIGPCLKQALKEAKNPEIDLIAVTIGPGLIPSLLIGVNFAKAFSYAQHLPLVGINHIEGHIYANWFGSQPVFPALCLIVSGGHTQLVLMKKHGQYQLLGQTRDDAAGEAFDKTAKLLGLGYPGGPIISQKAEKGNPQSFDLPRPMLNKNNFDFSFSGLKTAVLYQIKQSKKIDRRYVNNMAASFEQAAVDVLIQKTIKAVKKYEPQTIMLCGGVAANQRLRKELKQAVRKLSKRLLVPSVKLCTDNGAMIALAGYFHFKKAGKNNWKNLLADANLILGQ